LIGQGMTGLFAQEAVSAAQRESVSKILAAVGESVWVEDESLIDAVTAVSGSGPAYVFYFIEALEQGGVKLGLPAEVARKLAIRTLVGASALADASPESPAVLRERVTSKGGTTAAALGCLAEGGFLPLIERALDAAAKRGAELGDQLGKD
jgi:pyrroline-5-carboxylate reductase